MKTFLRVIAFVTIGSLCVSLLGGCSRSSKGAGPIPFVGLTHRALVIGNASGAAMAALRSRYIIDTGTGSEDPGNYDMIIVDASANSPQSIHDNPGLAKFASAGKMIVILNGSDAQRDTILKGTVFAHARGDIPAAAFIPMQGGINGWTEVDFPVHLQQESAPDCAVLATDPCPVALVSPSPQDLTADAQRWVDAIQTRGAAIGGGVGPNPSGGPGQAAFTLDVVHPLTLQVASAINEMRSGSNGFFGDGHAYWCAGKDGPCGVSLGVALRENATFETIVSVLLEPNGTQYQHKVIVRQYALDSPTSLGADWQYGYWEQVLQQILSPSAPPYQYNKIFPLYTTLGFNAATALNSGPDGTWQSTYPMALTEALPANANNTTTLLTSQSHTEGVSVSVTAAKAPEVGASWSNSWTWAQTREISIKDWSVQQNGTSNVGYLYEASSGTKDTHAALLEYDRGEKPTGTYNLDTGESNLNDLQIGNQTSQSENVWISSGGPVGATEETLQSTAWFVQGEVYMFVHCNLTCAPSYYSATPYFSFPENIAIDFGAPGLQPPTQAPWTLHFSAWPTTVSQQTMVTGTVSIPDAAMNPGPIQISYVVEPVSTLLTTPSGEACPGNQYAFVPGNNVLNNGAPPLTVTIPAGETSVNFPLTVQTYNSQPYNVQVVAWQATGTLNDQTVPNLESAWCLTVPNTTI